MNTKVHKNGYVVKGFLFMTKRRHFTDPAVYGDWVGRSFAPTVMREELYFGRLPEGLVLSGPKGPAVVLGPCGYHNQKLVALDQVLGEKSEIKEKAINPKQSKALEIAEHLEELREILGMSQGDLALRIGLSKQTILKIEQGYMGFRLSTAEKLLRLAPLFEERMHSTWTK